MHRIIARALAGLGLGGGIAPVAGEKTVHGDVLCFQQYTPGDLLCGGKKVVGSAQRKYHQALMQHGSILLAQSEHAPTLPGVRELTGIAVAPARMEDALIRAVAEDTGWGLRHDDWSDVERERIAALTAEKYASAGWNEKR